MYRRKFTIILTAISFFILFTISYVFAKELTIINSKIKAQKASWVAGETSISRLPLKERQKRLGLHFPDKVFDNVVNVDISSSEKYQVALPPSLDWRNNGGNFVTSVRDQDNCGSCWAFATTRALESLTLIANNTPGYDLNLAEQILVSCSGAGDCGGYILI